MPEPAPVQAAGVHFPSRWLPKASRLDSTVPTRFNMYTYNCV